MNIQEATKKALEENKCITIPSEYGYIFFKIKPTNTIDNCQLLGADGSLPPKKINALSHGWQPSADDLISNKWIVVD